MNITKENVLKAREWWDARVDFKECGPYKWDDMVGIDQMKAYKYWIMWNGTQEQIIEAINDPC
jgi:hypothetical protein